MKTTDDTLGYVLYLEYRKVNKQIGRRIPLWKRLRKEEKEIWNKTIINFCELCRTLFKVLE